MFIRPIPLSTLIHTIEYEEIIEQGRYGNEFKPPVKIERVLVQFGTTIKRKTMANGTTEDRVVKATLFIDAAHSSPFFLMKENSIIHFDGQKFTVDMIEHSYSFKLHHYEVALL